MGLIQELVLGTQMPVFITVLCFEKLLKVPTFCFELLAVKDFNAQYRCVGGQTVYFKFSNCSPGRIGRLVAQYFSGFFSGNLSKMAAMRKLLRSADPLAKAETAEDSDSSTGACVHDFVIPLFFSRLKKLKPDQFENQGLNVKLLIGGANQKKRYAAKIRMPRVTDPSGSVDFPTGFG